MVYIRPDFDEINFLSSEECIKTETQVFALKDSWTQRNPMAPFYTLGAASYLDGIKKETYSIHVHKYNPLLKEHFGWLYDKLTLQLQTVLKAPVYYDERFALPGFHIFLAHPAFLLPVAKVHYDLQFLQIVWPEDYKGIDFSTQLSMTLSIRLPKAGGGLNLWDIEFKNYQTMSKEEINHYLAENPPTFHPYRIGNLVLHSGYRLHQIAPAKTLEEGDVRLTLQAHALFFKDRWLIYW